ncbi:MAG: SDR family NAD(P)-dependent oxidoreductase [FCB group bacterium]|nr:SDR family NAD(P)-dependent oxidoreductase [FCB group bacterium]
MNSISIIGMACIYPDANSPDELWKNVLACRKSFRPLPDCRLNNADYISKNGSSDSTYCRRAALIEGYKFDREKFKVAGNTYRSTDLTHWLALDVASRALADAGFPNAKGLKKDTTGVLIGNSLTGEFSRANVMRLRWPFVRRVVARQLESENWQPKKIQRFLLELEETYKSPFPEVGDETLAGGLANTIAGRICNHFDFGGGGYTIDGACSSSLLAIANACTALNSGDVDAVIAGGVDISLDPFELVGFSRLGALAAGEMRLFDINPTGFLPGEGCGMLVLMRTEDARRKGLKSHAEIRGFGISSDGSGGLTRPELDGQRLAVERAYRKAGFGMNTIAFLEAHGTGTTVGDETELNALITALKAAGAERPVTIGSVKANIGHTKAAAGAAGIIKTVMALENRILPPTTGIVDLKPILNHTTSILKVLYKGEPWPAEIGLRAGVSAFGFGGINVHIALEKPKLARSSSTVIKTALPVCAQDAELFLVTGKTRHEILDQVRTLIDTVKSISYAEFTDLSAALSRELKPKKYRLAVTAGSPDELILRLTSVLKRVDKKWLNIIEPEKGICLARGTLKKSKIAFIFPGQSSPVRLSAGFLGRRFSAVKAVYSKAHLERFNDRTSTATAQPAIVTAELGGLELLRRLGISAETAVGHSLGELTAMYWSGVLTASSALELAEVRGALMAEHTHERGAMAAIAAAPEQVAPLLQQEKELVVSCYNGPKRVVVSGALPEVKALIARFRKKKIGAALLPVKQAFHSSLMQPVISPMTKYLEKVGFSTPRRRYISTITGRKISPEIDAGRMLIDQLTSPVLFTEGILNLPSDIGLCIEVGPGKIMAGMISDWFATPVVSLDIGGKSIRGTLNAAGAAFVMGAAVDLEYLFEKRFFRPFNFNREFHFFENPCEKVPPPEHAVSGGLSAAAIASTPSVHRAGKNIAAQGVPDQVSTLDLLLKLIADKAELPVDSLDPGSNLLKDLHLNSISATQIVAEAAAEMDLAPLTAPLDFATASIGEIAAALDEMRLSDGNRKRSTAEEPPPGIEAWVRPFRINQVEVPLPSGFSEPAPHGEWILLADPDHDAAKQLVPILDKLPGSGILTVLSSEPHDEQLKLLLKVISTAKLLKGDKKYFVLVQRGRAAAGFARTFQHEFPDFLTCVLDVHPAKDLQEVVLEEVSSVRTYAEASYNKEGKRLERRLELLNLSPLEKLPLGAEDVLLVTGGGKGISAECALDLARQTGVKLVLLGRSAPADDMELNRNLKRFEAAGIGFDYIQCDLTLTASVEKAVASAQEQFGSVTAILHGAGVNHPKLLGDLTEVDLKSTLAPKVNGLRNLLGFIDPEKLKLLVSFGSIIAETGMTGEGDYALANGWLAYETENFARQHPKCRCLVLEWSIWSGVGMGERLGRVETLARSGITPISPDTGINLFRELLSAELPAIAIVISGRLGTIPTLSLEKPELPLLRFLERPVVYYPGIELITEAELSPATDLYLRDHQYQGELIFPGVMGLEAIAECATALVNADALPVISRIDFLRPVIIDKNEKVRLRLAAYVSAPNTVEVVLRSENTAFQTDHFRAVCHFDRRDIEKLSFSDRISSEESIDFDPSGLYGNLFFQSGRLQKLRSYTHLYAKGCCALLSEGGEEKWYSPFLPQKMLLGDHGSQDAALHAVQACIPHLQLLPVGVERWIPGDLAAAGPWQVRAEERSHEGDHYTYDLEITTVEGILREQWLGLKFKRIAELPRPSWPLPLLTPYLERKIEEITGKDEVRALIRLQKDPGRDTGTEDLFRELIGSEEGVFYRKDGKPLAQGQFTLSAAHAGDLTLALAIPGKYRLGCDLHCPDGRSDPAWQRILRAEHLKLARLISTELNETDDASCSRIWTAAESLKKAGMMPDTPLTLDSVRKDGWVLLKAGSCRVLSYIAIIETVKYPCAIAVLLEEAV